MDDETFKSFIDTVMYVHEKSPHSKLHRSLKDVSSRILEKLVVGLCVDGAKSSLNAAKRLDEVQRQRRQYDEDEANDRQQVMDEEEEEESEEAFF